MDDIVIYAFILSEHQRTFELLMKDSVRLIYNFNLKIANSSKNIISNPRKLEAVREMPIFKVKKPWTSRLLQMIYSTVSTKLLKLKKLLTVLMNNSHFNILKELVHNTLISISLLYLQQTHQTLTNSELKYDSYEKETPAIKPLSDPIKRLIPARTINENLAKIIGMAMKFQTRRFPKFTTLTMYKWLRVRQNTSCKITHKPRYKNYKLLEGSRRKEILQLSETIFAAMKTELANTVLLVHLEDNMLLSITIGASDVPISAVLQHHITTRNLKSVHQFRYVDYIGQFTIDIRHISGKENITADTLFVIVTVAMTPIIDYVHSETTIYNIPELIKTALPLETSCENIKSGFSFKETYSYNENIWKEQHWKEQHIVQKKLRLSFGSSGFR
uniref:Uncharacterized protein n=1 Tax=Vespula pensylvanica TaxID=30213 RepID=A0A834N4X6_VESPE|nr:hypothetical protein H0235_017068 [Vespula pensylvanica]